jgi:protocatechuate 3,4-dioxygenase, beta subunit
MLKMLILAAAAGAVMLPPESGLNVGEGVYAFHPQHVTGHHKGTDACPLWTYGRRPQIQVWINNDDSKNVETLVKTLNAAVQENKDKELKAFLIFVSDEDKKAVESKLSSLAETTSVKDLPFTYVSTKDKSVKDYKINVSPEVKNTVMVYVKKRITAKFVNLKADEKGLAELKSAISSVVQ